MGDLHFVLPALNLSTLQAGILIRMQEVRLMMISLNMVDYSMSFVLPIAVHLDLAEQVERVILSHLYSLAQPS